MNKTDDEDVCPRMHYAWYIFFICLTQAYLMVIAAFHLGLTPIERPGTDSFEPRKIIIYAISYTSCCSGRKKAQNKL